jgi:hypothetical protein
MYGYTSDQNRTEIVYIFPALFSAEHTLRVFENTVLRSIFGPKRDGVTGGW